MEHTKNSFTFIRNNFQFIYGVVLIVLIPAALVVNTVVFINSTGRAIDIELQRKASLANSIVSVDVLENLDNTEALQSIVRRTVAMSEEVHSLDILVPHGSDFKIIASMDTERIGEISKYHYNRLAWAGGQPIAYDTDSSALSTEDQGERSEDHFWVVVNPVTDGSGEKVAIVSIKLSSGVMDDLTQRNVNQSITILIISLVIIILLLLNNTKLFQYAALFRKLKEVDKMKDEFISMASHELRAPITGIRGYLQMILDGSFGNLPAEANGKLKMVLEESERLHDLVEDLLEVSRIQQGRIELKLGSYGIGAIIDSSKRSFEQQAAEKGLELRIMVAPGLPNVSVDESRMKQVLVNLLSNSIKYTQQGSVTVSAELVKGREDTVKLKVSDTGIGMSAKDREHLFEKFYRVRNEQTDKIVGTGLGLWITREIIQLMHGEIFVDSIEGTGTQVTVLLPPFNRQKKK
ncbi:MAG: HAMP domain-containing sensor histidine kinase [Patescibacteria group bacterium]